MVVSRGTVTLLLLVAIAIAAGALLFAIKARRDGAGRALRIALGVLGVAAIAVLVLAAGATRVIRLRDGGAGAGVTAEQAVAIDPLALHFGGVHLRIQNDSTRPARLIAKSYAAAGGGPHADETTTIAPGASLDVAASIRFIGPEQEPPHEITANGELGVLYWLTW